MLLSFGIYGNNASYSGNCDTELACRSAAVKWTVWRIQHPNAWRANTRPVLITRMVAIFAFQKRRYIDLGDLMKEKS